MSDSFYTLSPDLVLDVVEEAVQTRGVKILVTGRVVPLNSIENRVYDIEIEDASEGRKSVVAKFYRPGRWNQSQILEEHLFLRRLKALEVPVVDPIDLCVSGGPFKKIQWRSDEKLPTLAQADNGIYFALFQKIRGRSQDELSDEMLLTLGRFLGRLHKVGQSMDAKSTRRHLNVETYGWESLEFLQQTSFLDSPLGERYSQVAFDLLKHVEPLMNGWAVQRVHGDCHLGNLLWLQQSPIFVDFDDMVVAPPVQDIWMIVGGRDEDAQHRRKVLLDGYTQMNEFDPDSLVLIEPLRALRLLHYSAWIARRWADPSFPKMFPHFGGEKWWQEEIEALSQIQSILSE